jgi:hypothetical protein
MDKTQIKQEQVTESKQAIIDLDSEILLLQEELNRVQEIKSKEQQRDILLQELNKLK